MSARMLVHFVFNIFICVGNSLEHILVFFVGSSLECSVFIFVCIIH